MQFLLLIGLIVLGFTLGRLGWLQQRQVGWGNKYIIYIALPVVALAKIPTLEVDPDLSLFVVTPITLFIGSLVMFQLIFRRFLEPDQRLVLSLTSGLGNTSFVGFPLIIYYFGSDYLPYGALYDQTTFLLMASFGQAMIVKREGLDGFVHTLKKVLTFPVFVVIVIAFMIPADSFGEPVLMVFDWVIQSLTIVAMIIVGFLIAKYVTFPFPRLVWLGLGYKLILAPAIVFLVMKMISMSQDLEQVNVLETAMAPQTSICLMLLEHEKLPSLVSQILCWGVVLSLGVSFLWMML
ncbi:AEC family transporter [Marinoscillum pacificum]|uniref:AEC family transporter n=1 Tax=Marinoscillum pacificum TaxID=392723 RepID=UPI0021575198|nr:AEC family transporter [Marinoscillum pacificum]